MNKFTESYETQSELPSIEIGAHPYNPDLPITHTTTEDGEIIKRPFIFTPYNYDKQLKSSETGLMCDPKENMTQQQFKEECDINTIMKNYGVTGTLPMTKKTPLTDDYSEGVEDYQTAMNMIIEAKEAFAELPAKARKEFDNDPQKFMEFMENKPDESEMIRLGLATKKQIELPIAKEPDKEPAKKEDKT